MILGCIADDFTGGSDLADTLARGGMATTQFIGVPDDLAPPYCEAGIVSLKIRSVPVPEAVSAALSALDWLRRQGCRQIFYKYCSTFDSTRQGNIGPVAEALLDELGAPVAVVCPAFPNNGRTIYQGHLFVRGRLLSESGMENHPLTPMTDPDICRWLRYQTRSEVGLITYSVVRKGGAAIADALKAEAAKGHRLVVVDAIDADDLLAIGSALRDAALVTGGSGIASGLPANFRAAGLLSSGSSNWSPINGPGVVLSGSCSPQSQLQVSEYIKSHPAIHLVTGEVIAGRQTIAEVSARLAELADQQPLAYSTASASEIGAIQSKYGQQASAHAIETFFAGLAVELARRGFSRFIIGGGETSGAILTALGISQLTIGPEIDPGVPAMASSKDGKPMGFALKSGNFGAGNFYEKAMCIVAEGVSR